MKILFTLLVVFLTVISGVCEESLIPVEEFYISVNTNDFMNRPHGRKGLSVSVGVLRGKEDPQGQTITDINCFEFPAGKRMFLKEDIKVFYEAADAAKMGKVYLKETDTQIFMGIEKTIFKSIHMDGEWVVMVSRLGKDAVFSANEGDSLKKALHQAKLGQAWFKLLLNSEKLPKETPTAKPPLSNGYYLSSEIGEVSGRGISYAVSVSARGRGRNRAPNYNITHELSYSGAHGKMGTSSGQWVSGLLAEITIALEAIKKGKAYSHKSQGYSVKANLKTKEADVTWYLGVFFKGETPKKGHFGVEELNEIRTLIKSYDVKKKWFEEHEHWFYTKPKKDK